MECNYCGKELKTSGGFRRHLEGEVFNFQKRLQFWDEYNEARKNGYEGTPDKYAWGRVGGYLDQMGRERGGDAEVFVVDDD